MLTPARYSYRRLTCADVSLLKALLRVFGEAFDEIETYQRSAPSNDYLSRLLTKQHFIAVVVGQVRARSAGDLHIRSRRYRETSSNGRRQGVDR